MHKSLALRNVARQLASCRGCTRRRIGKPIVGEGNPDAAVVFVGEAPGRLEARMGRPFVGRAGQWLRRAIRPIGLNDDAVYLMNVVAYRPAGRKPSAPDVEHGRTHFVQQLDIIDPKIVVLLGSTACVGVLDEHLHVRDRHGTIVERGGRTYLITCHPSAAARFPAIRRAVQRDFQKLKRLVAQLPAR
jgi:DNA polymerase